LGKILEIIPHPVIALTLFPGNLCPDSRASVFHRMELLQADGPFFNRFTSVGDFTSMPTQCHKGVVFVRNIPLFSFFIVISIRHRQRPYSIPDHEDWQWNGNQRV